MHFSAFPKALQMIHLPSALLPKRHRRVGLRSLRALTMAEVK